MGEIPIDDLYSEDYDHRKKGTGRGAGMLLGGIIGGVITFLIMIIILLAYILPASTCTQSENPLVGIWKEVSESVNGKYIQFEEDYLMLSPDHTGLEFMKGNGYNETLIFHWESKKNNTLIISYYKGSMLVSMYSNYTITGNVLIITSKINESGGGQIIDVSTYEKVKK